MGPVLLLDMGVVVLLVGPAPGEADLPRVAVAIEMMVDELAAVVGVDVQDLEGQNLAHLGEGLDDPNLAKGTRCNSSSIIPKATGTRLAFLTLPRWALA